MVIDKLENASIYKNLMPPRIRRALDYLEITDFTKIEPGRYEIESTDIYMLVQEYFTKDISICKLEGHQKYIDIQYMVTGPELIGITTLKEDQLKGVSYENDCAFFDASTCMIKLDTGIFAIFFPDDLHMPCIKSNESSKVKKIVIKVAI